MRLERLKYAMLGTTNVERSVSFELVDTPRVVNGDSWAVTCKDPDGYLVTYYGAP